MGGRGGGGMERIEIGRREVEEVRDGKREERGKGGGGMEGGRERDEPTIINHSEGGADQRRRHSSGGGVEDGRATLLLVQLHDGHLGEGERKGKEGVAIWRKERGGREGGGREEGGERREERG